MITNDHKWSQLITHDMITNDHKLSPRKGNFDNLRYLLYDILQVFKHKKVTSVNKWPFHHKL